MFKNYLLYFVLFLGYILLYVVKIEKIIYDVNEKETKSKVDFVYQQF